MKKDYDLFKLLSLLCAFFFLNLSVTTAQSSTEYFQDETTGATVFTNSSNTFNLTSHFDIEEYGGYGHTSDDRYIGNGGSLLGSAGIIGSVTNVNDFYMYSCWIFPSDDGVLLSNAGDVIIRGKLNGSTQYTITKASASLNTNQSSENGFTYVDLSAYNSTAIDQLEFEVTGSLRYLAIDDFEYEMVPLATAPTLTTTAITSITQITASSGGDITDDGGASVTARGICWSTGTGPTTSNSKTTDGSGTGSFTSSITSLSANTTYYVRAYATNSVGTSYGDELSFTTLMDAPGNALNFDGVNSNVTTTDILTTGSTSHTLEVWVKIPLVGTGNLDSGERVGVIFGNYDGVNSGVVNYEIHDDGQVRWYIGGASQYGTQDLRDNEWHHLAFIRDKTANKLSIYIDGELELESASAEADQVFSKAQIIGMDQRSPSLADTPYFHGEMDELRIWNDVRTIEEIRANMKVAIIGDEADLATYYKFDHSSGSTLSDLTSNNNDGTLVNMVDADWVFSESMLYIPTANAETDLTANSFTANWEENYTASKYYLDVSTASDFSSYVTGYQDKEITGQTTVSQSVIGLISGTDYYYRIRAYNENTTNTSSNSNAISLTALATPTVTTQAVTSIASTTATGNGNITDLGVPNPTAYGVCWDTGGHATIADNKTDEGATSSTGAFTSDITSLSPNTTYYVRAYATNSAGIYYGSEVSFTTDMGTTTWTGAIDRTWADDSNWTNGEPNASYDAIIPSGLTNYPLVVIGTTAQANSLEVAAAAELTVQAISTLNLNNPIVVQSDASNSGSVISLGTINNNSGMKRTSTSAPNITYNRYMTGNEWHLLSAPVSGKSVVSLLSDAGNAINNDGTNYDMKAYTESSDSWGSSYTVATADNMISGQGYAIKRASDGLVSMSGLLVNSSVPIALSSSNNGWNLLGNPYTAALKATTDASTDYLLNVTNIAEMDASYAALYVWDENPSDPTNTNNYKMLNNAGTGTLYKSSPQVTFLQVGQGFFVKAKASAGNFIFNTSMLQHRPVVEYFKSDVTAWPNIELNAEIESAHASTSITFNRQMTNGLDVSFDAGLLNSYPEFALYSRLVEDYEGVNFMLQALPEEYDNLVVPIGLDAEAGEFVIFSAKSINIPEDYAVVLEDRAMNVFTDLSEEGEYVVQLDNGSEGTGRFFVRTSMKSALGIDDMDKQVYQVFGRVYANQVVIRGEVNGNAKIYSITGKLMADVNLKQATENTIPFYAEPGVYIVQISNEEGTFTQKFSWIK